MQTSQDWYVHTPPLHTLAMDLLAHASVGFDDDLKNEIPLSPPHDTSFSSLNDVLSAWERAHDSKNPVVCRSTFVDTSQDVPYAIDRPSFSQTMTGDG